MSDNLYDTSLISPVERVFNKWPEEISEFNKGFYLARRLCDRSFPDLDIPDPRDLNRTKPLRCLSRAYFASNRIYGKQSEAFRQGYSACALIAHIKLMHQAQARANNVFAPLSNERMIR